MHKPNTLQWLIQNTKKQNWKICVLIILNAVFSALSVLFAFCIREIINGATATDFTVGKSMIIRGAVFICSIVVLQFVLRLLINGLTEHISAKLEITYKSSLFDRILGKKYDKINGYHSGELLNRLSSDVKIVADGVTSVVPSVVAAGTRLICGVIALIIIDWIFAVAFCLAGILVSVVVIFTRNKLKNLHKDVQTTDGKIKSFMQECIENLLCVKVFSANDKIKDKAQVLQDDNYKTKMKRMRYSVTGRALYNFIFSAGYVFALIYGGAKLLNGQMQLVGDLTAILQLVNNVQVPFASLSSVLPTYYAMLASAERIMEIENISGDEVYDTVDLNGATALVFENVNFSYDREEVLKNVSFRIDFGAFVALTGQSGAGKSTIVKILLGVYGVENGSVYVECGDRKVPLNESTRKLFAYVPQGHMLFSGSLRENITLVKQDATEQEIADAVRCSCVEDFIGELPLGLDTVVGENGVGLSEGQIQRVAVARALLCNAEILLLDEATSALDDKTERKMLGNIKNKQGLTVITISHRKAVLELCDDHLELKNKAVVSA